MADEKVSGFKILDWDSPWACSGCGVCRGDVDMKLGQRGRLVFCRSCLPQIRRRLKEAYKAVEAKYAALRGAEGVRELPQSIAGICPDFTEGQDTAEWIKKRWDE